MTRCAWCRKMFTEDEWKSHDDARCYQNTAGGAEVNPFLEVVQREMTRDRRARCQLVACYMYNGDPAVLRERLQAATTPHQCDMIFNEWCDEVALALEQVSATNERAPGE